MNAFRAIRFVLGISVVGGLSFAAAEPRPQNQNQPSPARERPMAARPNDGKPPAVASAADPIDINTADLAKLEAHPLIGPHAARAIIAARPFSSPDDLNRLQGVSAERIEQIRGAVSVQAPVASSPAPDRAGPETGKIDINTADRATLEAIPAIGSDLAPAIIAARPFARIDELDRIQGISAERLEAIRTAVTVATPELATKKQPSRRDAGKKRALEPTTGRAAREAPR